MQEKRKQLMSLPKLFQSARLQKSLLSGEPNKVYMCCMRITKKLIYPLTKTIVKRTRTLTPVTLRPKIVL